MFKCMGTAFALNTNLLTIARGHPFKLVKTDVDNLELRRHFFTNRVVNQWNSSPCQVMQVVRRCTNCELL